MKSAWSQNSQNKKFETKKDSSNYELINGCKKEVSNKSFQNNGNDWTEWKKEYTKKGKQTCDFSAYIIYKKKFVNGNLKEETQYTSGCDECDEKPCGNWNYYDDNGTKIKTITHGECALTEFEKK